MAKEGSQMEWNEANYAGGGMYEPDDDGGKADVPDTHVSNLSDGEPDAVKAARPVR